MNRLFPLFLLLIGGIILTIGDLIMKEWVVKNRNWFYVLGILIYVVGLNFLAWSFKYKNIAIASVIFVIFNVITLTLVSWIVFKEKLTPLEIAGLLMGLFSIVILELAAA